MNYPVYPDEDLPELIVCAAQSFDGLVIPSVRHFDNVYWKIHDTFDSVHFYLSDNGKPIEGFITNKGRFVDRLEAYKIAVENNQIKRLCPTGSNRLYSEMLY